MRLLIRLCSFVLFWMLLRDLLKVHMLPGTIFYWMIRGFAVIMFYLRLFLSSSLMFSAVKGKFSILLSFLHSFGNKETFSLFDFDFLRGPSSLLGEVISQSVYLSSSLTLKAYFFLLFFHSSSFFTGKLLQLTYELVL